MAVISETLYCGLLYTVEVLLVLTVTVKLSAAWSLIALIASAPDTVVPSNSPYWEFAILSTDESYDP